MTAEVAHAVSGDSSDPVEVARLILLRQLTRGPRTREQLARACRRRGVPEDAITLVLDRFGELGLVDDDAYAQAWVQSRHAGRGLSRRALRYELRQRGVCDDSVEQALAPLDIDDEIAAATALVQARMPSLRRHDRPTQTRRLLGMLARRGYSSGMAARVVADAVDGADADGTADRMP